MVITFSGRSLWSVLFPNDYCNGPEVEVEKHDLYMIVKEEDQRRERQVMAKIEFNTLMLQSHESIIVLSW